MVDRGLTVYCEKRMFPERDRCAIEASLKVAENDTTLPCLVVDLSETGAGLSLDEAAELPSRFHLALPLMDEHVDERLVELRWRSGRAAGVLFIRP